MFWTEITLKITDDWTEETRELPKQKTFSIPKPGFPLPTRRTLINVTSRRIVSQPVKNIGIRGKSPQEKTSRLFELSLV